SSDKISSDGSIKIECTVKNTNYTNCFLAVSCKLSAERCFSHTKTTKIFVYLLELDPLNHEPSNPLF
ncbi:MAG: hypothetical protein P8Y62_05270, partial [candidate division WOR-3 bacterium]